MARRHTSTEKWDDPWFRHLSSKYKCAWLFIVDKCDNIGIWQVDMELMAFYVSDSIEKDELLRVLNEGKERIAVLRKDKWLVKDFVSYHWSNSPKMLRHIENLKRHHRLNDSLPIQYEYSSDTPEIKLNKIKLNKGVVRGKFQAPTHQDILNYKQEITGHIDPDRFIDFYESKGWMVGKNKMKDWKAAYRRANREWETKRDERPQKPKSEAFQNLERMMEE